jgi:hypothetical protein
LTINGQKESWAFLFLYGLFFMVFIWYN